MLSKLRIPWLSPSTGKLLVVTLLCVKLLVLAWNAVQFDGSVYDQAHHQDRALFGGLRPGKMAYDPPLYYLPALLIPRPADVPLVERHHKSQGDDEEAIASREAARSRAGPSERRHKARQLKLLRATNVALLAVVYIGFIFYAFPRLLKGFRSWLLASLLLLALPGYQKLAVMVHADNAFACFTTLGICAWLMVRGRWRPFRALGQKARPGKLAFSHLLLFAVVTGMVGLTRPFSVVTVLVLTGAVLLYLVRLEGFRPGRLVPRAVLLISIIGVLSGSWYVYRWHESGAVTNAYRDRYIEKYASRRPGFDWVGYFTTLHVRDLLETPNRKFPNSSVSMYANNPHANSFFTLLHSEVWGDHWLYFSSSNRAREGKLWPKRVLLAAALPMLAIGPALSLAYAWDVVRRIRRSWSELSLASRLTKVRELISRFELDLVLLGIAGLGALLYLYWQTGPALLPGKNSTIKFIYIASLCGPAIALLFRRRPSAITFNLLSGYLLVLCLVSLPFVMFWPS